jgi:hypothetical protein
MLIPATSYIRIARRATGRRADEPPRRRTGLLLAAAFAEEHEIAGEWLRASREERIRFWSPTRLRERAGGRFLKTDYWHHCEMGGHPATRGMSLLPGHTKGLHVREVERRASAPGRGRCPRPMKRSSANSFQRGRRGGDHRAGGGLPVRQLRGLLFAFGGHFSKAATARWGRSQAAGSAL